MKSFSFGRFLNWICVKNSVESTWPLEPTHFPLERFGHLSGKACLSCPKRLSIPGYLSNLALFQKLILNHFKFKTKLIPFIPQMSLTCHKPNLFRYTCDFLVGRTTTLNLQWRASHYLKRFIWSNIKKNKNFKHNNKTQCPNNLPLWQFYDKNNVT